VIKHSVDDSTFIKTYLLNKTKHQQH